MKIKVKAGIILHAKVKCYGSGNYTFGKHILSNTKLSGIMGGHKKRES
jgi:hypothetical protein